jgi:hypothetical protein
VEQRQEVECRGAEAVEKDHGREAAAASHVEEVDLARRGPYLAAAVAVELE